MDAIVATNKLSISFLFYLQIITRPRNVLNKLKTSIIIMLLTADQFCVLSNINFVVVLHCG